MTMSEDISKYPIFLLVRGKLIKTNKIKTIDDYNHYTHNLHHFIPQSLKKTNLAFYKRVEQLQKLILLPIKTHSDAHSYAEDTFKNKYGIDKHQILFNRSLWREGIYD